MACGACQTENDYEMINIYLGKTYYQNGELLKKPIPNHNEYLIKNISYQIFPTYGQVLLYSDIFKNFARSSILYNISDP